MSILRARPIFRPSLRVFFGARLNDSTGVPEVARAARERRHADQELSVGDLLLDSFSALVDDYDAAIPLCRDALKQIRANPHAPSDIGHWLWHATILAEELWDDKSAVFTSQLHVQVARTTGALSELSVALSSAIPVLVQCGEISAAASLVGEAASVHEATGIEAAPYGAVRVAAWRGHDREARDLIDATSRDAATRGYGIGVAMCEYARAVLCNGSAQYEEAVDAAQRASRHHELVAENRALPELIESAARTGGTDVAADALARLSRKARACSTEWALGLETRSRALLSHGQVAETLYREAIDHLSRTLVRPELARAHLLYGEWLRREGRRTDARKQLHAAHDMLAADGIDAFAERTRRELVATGEKVRKRTVERRATSSLLRKSRSPGLLVRVCRTRRSAPSSSSARAPSNGTFARCSPSSASAPAGSFGQPYPKAGGSSERRASSDVRYVIQT